MTSCRLAIWGSLRPSAKSDRLDGTRNYHPFPTQHTMTIQLCKVTSRLSYYQRRWKQHIFRLAEKRAENNCNDDSVGISHRAALWAALSDVNQRCFSQNPDTKLDFRCYSFCVCLPIDSLTFPQKRAETISHRYHDTNYWVDGKGRA